MARKGNLSCSCCGRMDLTDTEEKRLLSIEKEYKEMFKESGSYKTFRLDAKEERWLIRTLKRVAGVK